MAMLNARTWHWLCVSALMMFPAALVVWFLPESSPFHWIGLAAIAWGLLIAATGVILGIKFSRGTLYMGCPICGKRSQIENGGRDGAQMACPRCGGLRLSIGSLTGLKVVRIGTEEDDLADYIPPPSPLLAPVRYPISFIMIFSPVIVSIAAATFIHEFLFAYILIPGFFCYGVGGHLLTGIYHGSLSDNTGTALRSRHPLRFWRKVVLLSLIYIFAAAVPVIYSLQEKS